MINYNIKNKYSSNKEYCDGDFKIQGGERTEIPCNKEDVANIYKLETNTVSQIDPLPHINRQIKYNSTHYLSFYT